LLCGPRYLPDGLPDPSVNQDYSSIPANETAFTISPGVELAYQKEKLIGMDSSHSGSNRGACRKTLNKLGDLALLRDIICQTELLGIPLVRTLIFSVRSREKGHGKVIEKTLSASR
jgi:hypothetical protein